MKKIVALVMAGFTCGTVFAADIMDLLSTIDKVEKFNKNLPERKKELNEILVKIKNSKGAEKADEILNLTLSGLKFLDDVALILSTGISGISGTLQSEWLPAQVKDAGKKLNSLFYITEQDEAAKKMTGAIGSSLAMIQKMSANMTEFKKMLDKQKTHDNEMKQRLEDYEAKIKEYEGMLKECGKTVTPAVKPAPLAADEDLLF